MNLIELSEKFPTELSCIEYAESVRFGKKTKCAYCASVNLTTRRTDHRHKCRDCNKSTAVTVNTHLHNTRIPLKTWFYAISVITDAKKGMSALQLQRNISVSYPTAFKLYHKLRKMMMVENANIDELSGIVEMDEVFIGGKPRKMNTPHITFDSENPAVRIAAARGKTREDLDQQIEDLEDEGWDFTPQGHNRAKIDAKNQRGSKGAGRIPVVGIVQRNGNVVAEVMHTLTYTNLKDMVKKYVVEDESVLITDNYAGYNSMKKIIDHLKIDHNQLYSYKGVNSNTIESFWAIIERGIMGQYHSVSPKMLPNYVAEFVYKYNNRHDNAGMFHEMVFKLLQPVNE